MGAPDNTRLGKPRPTPATATQPGRTPRGLLVTVLALASVSGLVLSGCSGKTPSRDAGATPRASVSATLNPDLKAKYPKTIQKAGTIKIGVSPNFPPLEFKNDDGTLTGSEVDLARAIGQTTGLRVELVETNFAGLLSGLQAKRFDMVLSGVTDTREREQQVTFVNYLNVGTNFLVRGEDAKAVSTPADLCGKTMAVTIGTSYVQELEALSKKHCTAGKATIKVQTFDTANDVKQAIVTKRAFGTYGAVSANAYSAKQSEGALATAGRIQSRGLSGAVVPKADIELIGAIEATLTSLLADGTIKAVLTRYGEPDQVVRKIRVNGATS